MKKLLAGVALLATMSLTYAQTEIYGLIDMSYNQITSDGVSKQSQTAIGGAASTGANSANGTGTLNGSRLGFKVVEDIGNGTKVGAVIEYGLNLTSSTDTQAGQTAGVALANIRQGYISVQNINWGTVEAGTLYTFIDGASGSLGGAIANGGTNSVVGAANLLKYGLGGTPRNSNAISYTSPSFAGLRVRVLRGYGETVTNSTTQNNADASSLGVDYTNGKFSAGWAMYKLDNVTNTDTSVVDHIGTANDTTAVDNDGTANVKQIIFGGSYDFGFAKVGLNRSSYINDVVSSSKVDIKSSQTALSATIPLAGGWSLHPAYTTGQIDTSGTKAYDTKGIDLIGVYTVSKRTNFYVAHNKTAYTSVSSGVEYNQQSYSLGMRHSF